MGPLRHERAAAPELRRVVRAVLMELLGLSAVMLVACTPSTHDVATTPPATTATASATPQADCATIPDMIAAQFPASPSVTNRYLPDTPGMQYVLSGSVTVGGHRQPHQIVSTVTDLTKLVDGVTTVVIFEQDLQRGVVQESELLFAAQDVGGTVWHVGEYPEVYENGRLLGAPDTWLSGVAGAQAGIDMPPSPSAGEILMQGYSPAIRFWDCARVVALNEHRCARTGCYENVVVTDEYSPTAPTGGRQLKYNAPGVGTIEALPLGDPQPETVTLVKAICLSPGALAAIRQATLSQDRRAYHVARGVYAHSPPAVRTLQGVTC